jgi:hypothetical protein
MSDDGTIHSVDIANSELQDHVAYSSPVSPRASFLVNRPRTGHRLSNAELLPEGTYVEGLQYSPQKQTLAGPKGAEEIAMNECENSTTMRDRIRNMTIDCNGSIGNKGWVQFSFQPLKRWYNGINFFRRFHYFNIFSRTIHSTEKRFGSGIANYYEFMTVFVYVNIMIFICTFLLLILPWLLQPTSAYTALGDWKLLLGLIGYDSIVIGKSWFFYGGYPEYMMLGSFQWSFTFFYAFCVILYMFLSMVFICTALGNRLGKESGHTNQKNKYVQTVFNTWDWSLQEEYAIEAMKQGLATKLAELLVYDENMQTYTEVKTPCQKFLFYARRCTGIIISLCFMVAAPACAAFITSYYDYLNSLFGPLTSILNAVINAVFPQITTLCVIYIEKYTDARYINANIVARTYIIKMSTTIAVIVRVMTGSDTGLTNGKCRSTEAGLLYWQMLLIDFLVTAFFQIVVALVLYFIRMFRAKRKDKTDTTSYKLNFEVSGQVIGLLYRQTVVWVGTINCPMLPLVGTFTNFTLFFTTYFIMRFTCKFPDNPEANARSSFFNHAVMLFTLIICLIPAFAFML